MSPRVREILKHLLEDPTILNSFRRSDINLINKTRIASSYLIISKMFGFILSSIIKNLISKNYSNKIPLKIVLNINTTYS